MNDVIENQILSPIFENSPNENISHSDALLLENNTATNGDIAETISEQISEIRNSSDKKSTNNLKNVDCDNVTNVNPSDNSVTIFEEILAEDINNDTLCIGIP